MKVRGVILLFALCFCASVCSSAIGEFENSESRDEPSSIEQHSRPKRTLFLKKKLLGAGLLGFGLGIAKGYKAGYLHGPPEVHHVYLAPPPPPIKYYVEKPVYIERIVDRPVFKEESPAWSDEPSSPPGYVY